VRFTDETTKTGEFGIRNWDHAELGIYPGYELNTATRLTWWISAVGALTGGTSLQARVWYFQRPTVCNGSARRQYGSTLLDRPHRRWISCRARQALLQPGHVNQWWLCDEGRYGWAGSIARLDKVRRAVRDPANGERGQCHVGKKLTAISTALIRLCKEQGARIGVIASAPPTGAFSDREIFAARGASQRFCSGSGSSDDFLIQRTEPQHTGGNPVGPGRPGAPSAGQIVDEAIAGNLDFLWIMGHDLVDLFGEGGPPALRKVGLFVFRARTERDRAFLHMGPPGAACGEGRTFVNCHGRVNIGCAFPPLRVTRTGASS
jgi:hypothetical protein